MSAVLPPPRIGDGLAAAGLFARGQAAGLVRMPAGPAAAWHAQRAALLCLPAFLLIRLLLWETPPGGALRGLVVEVAGFAVAWAGFLLASRPVAAALGRGEAWPRFVTAWAWAAVAQYGALLGASMLGAAGLPAAVAQVTGLVALGYALWLEWFTTRVALGVGAGWAVALVVLDLGIGVFVAGITARLGGG